MEMVANRTTGSLAKVAHVNLMTDTTIANLSPDALRTVLRSMLAADQDGNLTSTLQYHVQKYLLTDLRRASVPILFSNTSSASPTPTPELANLRKRILSVLGSGLAFESIALLAEVVRQSRNLSLNESSAEGEELADALAAVDGDLVQALTAVKKVVTNNGERKRMPAAQKQVLLELQRDLEDCQRMSQARGAEFMFERGATMLAGVLSTWG